MIPSRFSPACSGPARIAPALSYIAIAHSLNDLFQAVLPSLYPDLQSRFQLSYAQLGIITLVFHLVGSLGQPAVGWYTDRRPSPLLLPCSMMCMLAGMSLLAFADSFVDFLFVAAAVGLGSSIFHPEGARAARMASGGRLGTAQSIFQLGGNVGSAAAPLLLATLLIMPTKPMALCLAALAVAGFLLLRKAAQLNSSGASSARFSASPLAQLSRGKKTRALILLTVLVLSKYVYLACIANFYMFFVIERFSASIQQAQMALFVFLLAIALGTLFGGPVVDRFGRRAVIAWSIFGSCPFALLLPHVSFAATIGLSVVIGLVIASAFAAIILMAQELLPGRIGLVAGAFFGLTFGISGIAAAGLGAMADHWGIIKTFNAASYLPLLGALALFLPKDARRESPA
jgi:FSR family fosmidomycin resistance protein-like MFS transporter